MLDAVCFCLIGKSARTLICKSFKFGSIILVKSSHSFCFGCNTSNLLLPHRKTSKNSELIRAQICVIVITIIFVASALITAIISCLNLSHKKNRKGSSLNLNFKFQSRYPHSVSVIQLQN